MPVLDRSELEASPLADLHAIADQLGLESFRRLRKADLVDAILAGSGSAGAEDRDGVDDRDRDGDGDEPASRVRGRLRRRRARRPADEREEEPAAAVADSDQEAEVEERPARRPPRSRGRVRGPERDATDSGDAGPGDTRSAGPGDTRSAGPGDTRSGRVPEPASGPEPASVPRSGQPVASGVVEVLGNGSAFLRVEPPEPSDADVYISAAQVRRCELVSGDRVTGPVRTPRRSERYPSLVRVDTINDEPAESVSDGSRYEDLPVAWPSERLQLGSRDRTLEAIEWLAPFGLGSRVVLIGGRLAGKTRTLQRIREALAERDELTLAVVLAGARPEELADWSSAGSGDAADPRSDEQPAVAALTMAASPDSQAQAIERALDAARRLAARGGNAVVLIDSLDGLSASAARKALAAARNLRDGGSLTIIATASEPLGGETTVIALDPNLTTTGREPILDLLASGTVRAELLVGDDGAQAIARARMEAMDRG